MTETTLPPKTTARFVLPVLVLAQLLGISIWFSSSAALPSLTREWGLAPADGGLLISAVQVGFIVGTLLFALTNVADLFPASRVFFVCTLVGAAVNLLFAFVADGLAVALLCRLLTGLALAGIYPVGMKVVVSWSTGGVGNALGWLVGALTVGSASPFLLAYAGAELHWRVVMGMASLLALLAGLMVLWVGDGPHLGKAQRLRLSMLLQVFRIPQYRRAALGYFGHMWELYAFWVLTPLLAGTALRAMGQQDPRMVSLWAFIVMGVGGLGCVAGGLLSRRVGSRAVASVSLAVSGTACLLAPLAYAMGGAAFMALLLVWGVFVVSDSAQFSALSAQACPPEYVGTALTIQNCIGFAITIITIELTHQHWATLGPHVAWILAPGPLLGLLLLNWGREKK